MARTQPRRKQNLFDRYPPSEPCSCEICLGYCARPGWWTVAQAAQAIAAGYAGRMMLELAPDFSFGVLAPAFRGCQGGIAAQEFAGRGCCFLIEGRCMLHGTGLQPLECRFCHHDRLGQGQECHAALERDWNTPAGQVLMQAWARETGMWRQVGWFLSPR